jgi:Fe-S-cluster containining protein
MRHPPGTANPTDNCDQRRSGVSYRSGGWSIPFDHNGDCVFLNNDRCSIYEEHPVACRTFNCLSGYEAHGSGRHAFFLQDNPDVLRLVQVTLATK